jgi:hypothetical protein
MGRGGALSGTGARRIIAALPLFFGAAAMILLAASPMWRGGKAVVLDGINPFGSVQDDSLPSQLGQPPRLGHLMSTSYGPGFNDVGEPMGTRRQALSSPYVNVISPSPHVETGQISAQEYFQEKGKRGRCGPST